MTSPGSTQSPTLTAGSSARFAYTVQEPSPWFTVTTVPYKSSSTTLSTEPACDAETVLPIAASMSIPSWVRQSRMVTS